MNNFTFKDLKPTIELYIDDLKNSNESIFYRGQAAISSTTLSRSIRRQRVEKEIPTFVMFNLIHLLLRRSYNFIHIVYLRSSKLWNSFSFHFDRRPPLNSPNSPRTKILVTPLDLGTPIPIDFVFLILIFNPTSLSCCFIGLFFALNTICMYVKEKRCHWRSPDHEVIHWYPIGCHLSHLRYISSWLYT